MVLNFLHRRGIYSYVEGAIDDLDLDPCYNFDEDPSEKLEWTDVPVSVYQYSESDLQNLAEGLLNHLGERVDLDLLEHSTEAWQHGWRDSFKVIETDRFTIFPPWDRPKANSAKIGIEVEPGMAFGTGQHETTMLCVKAIEKITEDLDPTQKSFADIGCGTGILSIAAAKLGFKKVSATDIDEDACLATKENAKTNHVEIHTTRSQIPNLGKHDVVVANIISSVLKKIWTPILQTISNEGHLLISGILSEEVEEFEILGRESGLKVLESNPLGGWAQIHFLKNHPENI